MKFQYYFEFVFKIKAFIASRTRHKTHIFALFDFIIFVQFTMFYHKMFSMTKNWFWRQLQLDIDFKTLFELNSDHLGILGKIKFSTFLS